MKDKSPIKSSTHQVDFCQESSVTASRDQSLLDAALTAKIPIFHVCGGEAKCSTCRVLVLRGEDSLSPPNRRERNLKDKMNFPPDVRLACQTRITGSNVKVARIIRDQEDIDLYVGPTAGGATQQIGEEKNLVLFFLDIRNFTSFLESNLAFDVIHIIRKLFITFHDIIEKFNGKIIETAGDGIYAVFGLNTFSVQENVSFSTRAGYAILSKVRNLNKKYFEKFFSYKIEIGIGVHQGTVISGNIKLGTDNRMIIMGFPVNVASRLQNATKELNNDFIISSSAYDLLKGPPASLQTASLYLKGVSQPIKVYLLGKPYQMSLTENGTEQTLGLMP